MDFLKYFYYIKSFYYSKSFYCSKSFNIIRNFTDTKCFKLFMIKYIYLSNFTQFHYFQHDT